jgi:hypothetical protein
MLADPKPACCLAKVFHLVCLAITVIVKPVAHLLEVHIVMHAYKGRAIVRTSINSICARIRVWTIAWLTL